MKQTPLLRKTPLLRTKRIRRQSTKAKRTADIRRKQALARMGDPCDVRWDEGCYGLGQVLHEPLLRSRGGDPTDPKNQRWICHYCHQQIHLNPKEATRRGWMKGVWVCTDLEATG